MHSHISKVILLLLLLGVLTSCTSVAATPVEPVTLRVMTHDSFTLSEPVVKAFEDANQVKLEFIKSGDTGASLNRAILTKNAPQADVFYGVDNTFLTRALKEKLFAAYASPQLSNIDAQFKLDPDNYLLPVDYGDVCINYDKAYFDQNKLPIPSTFDDLLKPELKGLLVTENPATSSPGLAFLLATIQKYGPQGYLEYWKALKENGLVIVNDWETAYYTNFSASSGKGPQPMVVSYGTSPAAEVVFSSTPITESPTASITGDGMCFRQIEFIGILNSTKHPDLARKFVDAMLDTPIQEDIPLQMFVFPVNKNAALPAVFTANIQSPQNPTSMDPNQIDQNREKWLQEWTDTILK